MKDLGIEMTENTSPDEVTKTTFETPTVTGLLFERFLEPGRTAPPDLMSEADYLFDSRVREATAAALANSSHLRTHEIFGLWLEAVRETWDKGLPLTPYESKCLAEEENRIAGK